MYIVSFFIECIYWSFRLLYWVSCLWKFVCELLRGYHLLVSISLCILRVRDKWPFPRDSGSLSSPSLHTLVFDYSPWLDLSGLLIHFLSIYLFFSSYLIRLVYIVLYSYWFTFCIQYFPHIILIHSISSSILFFSSFSSLIYWYFFFLFYWYIYGRPQIHGLWDSLHVLHFIHEGMRVYHWDYWA